MKETATLDIRVRTCSNRNAVSKVEHETVYISIKAPAKNNKANIELMKYLGKLLGVGQENIRILRGASSSSKVILIEGMSNKSAIIEKLGSKTER
eukprot:jgi/Antlo1/1958/130